MNPYGKQKSRISNIARIYNFENGKNGGLGPGFFIKKFITNNITNNITTNNIVKKKYDLSIHVVFTKVEGGFNPYNLISLIKNNVYNVYNLNIQTYLIDIDDPTLSNPSDTLDEFKSKIINPIITNIKRDENKCFLILDWTTWAFFSSIEDLNIPFYVYDKLVQEEIVLTNNRLLSNINSILFYKIEEKIKNIKK